MNDKYAKILFDILGSQELPTDDRNAFINFFDDYRRAVAKSNSIKTLVDFLQENTDIGAFYVEMEQERDDDGNNYDTPQNMQFFDIDGRERMEYESDTHSELYDLLSYSSVLALISGEMVSLATLPTILKKCLTPQEATALDMVNNYERNKLNADIAPAVKQKQVKL